ncbi:MAG: endonuclease domain-containing protein [Solirubrobacteraceae bacterium MAG38_C4-C5]|nr:endonuclease domain-containing protein [Candidatus Siliceabacter maunaloa]
MSTAWRITPALRGQNANRQIVAVAEAQHAMIHRSQLLAIGLGSNAIDRRIAIGGLHVMYPGVYALGHRVVTLKGRWMAAVLACGPAAKLSHRDGAALVGLRPASGSLYEVTVPGGRGRGLKGIRVHRSVLAPDEVTVIDAISTTTWARTLIDLAALLPPHQLARALEQAEILRIFDLNALQPLLDRHARRPGVPALNRALEEHRPETHRTRNDLEELLVHLCRQADLPLPTALNASLDLPGVGRIEPDAIWREHKVIVEVDGFETHGTRAMFESDRVRDAELQILGWRVLRTTWLQLERAPHEFLDRLRRLLRTAG